MTTCPPQLPARGLDGVKADTGLAADEQVSHWGGQVYDKP